MREVKAEMVRLGIKQVEMAKRLQINNSQLNKILNGWREPDEETQEKILSFIEKRRRFQRRYILRKGPTS